MIKHFMSVLSPETGYRVSVTLEITFFFFFLNLRRADRPNLTNWTFALPFQREPILKRKEPIESKEWNKSACVVESRMM